MRQLYKIAALGAVGLFLTGCADTTIDYITVEKPQNIADFEYLDAYKPLKEYIDRAAHPGFLLGTGVSASDYIQKGLVYRMTNSNFDQITAGNEMKYASIVNDQGNMDFSTVEAFVEAAQAAGISIYGHTLCWHEQQNVKWLNSLIADKEMEVDPNGGNHFLAYDCGSAGANTWDKQATYALSVPMTKGNNYKVSVKVKGTASDTGDSKVGLWPIWEASENKNEWGGSNDVQYLAEHEFATDWQTVEWTFDAAFDHDKLQFVFGKHGGKILFDELSVIDNTTGTKLVETIDFEDGNADNWGNNWGGPTFSVSTEAPVMEIGVSLISGGDADKGETDNLIAREPGKEDYAAKVVDDPAGTGKVYESPFNANPGTEWDSQFFIVSNEALEPGTKVHVKFRYKATESRAIDTQAHGKPGEYHHWAFIGTLNATTEWQEHEYNGVISADQGKDGGCKAIAFNLCKGSTAGSLYVDDVVFEKLISANSIPMTPEEKYEVLDAEMERWVKGMMEATKGYVTAWDVVNEAISGGPWGQRYDLQHAATSDNPSNKFFWQDYLGDNFVRVPIKYARQYFEENGGNPADLKLFINDYNLESDWDDNQKLKSLIQWIEQWESDGVTKIDGIGSQMHISYYLNPQTQKSKEDHIVKMLELMAKTGKLVRITELDMGLVDENGNDIPTDQVTLEQHKLMGDHYEWIIKKYFEIIPVAQQYGICQWAQTDSPTNSGWRANSPIGLWTLGNQRKPTYGGFAKGLGATE